MIRWSIAAALPLCLPAAALSQNVAEVQVAPPSVTIKVGERYGLLATAFDRGGNVIPTARTIWTSNNVGIARIDNNGTVTGVAAGVAIIEARVGSRKGQAAVQVTGTGGAVTTTTAPRTDQTPATGGPPPADGGGTGGVAPATGGGGGTVDPFAGQPAGTGPAAFLKIDPPAIYMLPSENIRAFPRALRDDGSPAAPVRVTWKSLREDIATVDQNGNVVGGAPGQGTIQISGPNGQTGTAPVVVAQAEIAIQEPGPIRLSPGQLDTLHVIVPAQNGRLVNPLALSWSTSDPSVAQVSPLGIVRASGPGKAALTMTGLLQTRTVDVMVHKAVAAFAIRPRATTEVTLPITSTLKFTAQPLAADNTPVPEAPLRWSLGDTLVAGFDVATGTLTGKVLGRTQLVVKAPGGASVTWTVNVIAGAVKLSAARFGLALEHKVALRASFVDSAGTALGPATGLSWASDNPQAATVGEDGTVSPVAYGHARITATAPGGKTATADAYVQGELVVASSRRGAFQLYALDQSNLQQLTKITRDTLQAIDPSFSPDGSRIAFVSSRDGNPEIYVMDADGSNTTRLTNDPAVDSRPVFGGDGQTVYFTSQRGPGGKQEIWSVGIDGSGLKQLTTDSVSLSPTVSPDGQIVAYVSLRNKNYDIWLMQRDGSNQRQFTRSPTQKESEPRFLRDGSLAFLVERQENGRTVQQVFKAELATGTTTPLTDASLPIVGFAVAPAGDLLAIVTTPNPDNRRNTQYKIYLLKVGSGTPVPIPTTGAEQMVTPAFQP